LGLVDKPFTQTIEFLFEILLGGGSVAVYRINLLLC
jgi:hypothetical protein